MTIADFAFAISISKVSNANDYIILTVSTLKYQVEKSFFTR